jgi:hypothetical protein
MFTALTATGFAAVGVGLLLSAGSGHSVAVANFLLPLVMIAQIVFSVAIVIEAKSYSYNPYEDFTWNTLSVSASRDSARASYLTLSRWGDKAIRSLQDEVCGSRSTDYWQGVSTLIACTLLLPLSAGLLVRWANPVRLRFFRQSERLASS